MPDNPIQAAARRKLSAKASPPKKGFANIAEGMAEKQGVSPDRARAMLAAGTRRAGPAARRLNPALNKVK